MSIFRHTCISLWTRHFQRQRLLNETNSPNFAFSQLNKTKQQDKNYIHPKWIKMQWNQVCYGYSMHSNNKFKWFCENTNFHLDSQNNVLFNKLCVDIEVVLSEPSVPQLQQNIKNNPNAIWWKCYIYLDNNPHVTTEDTISTSNKVYLIIWRNIFVPIHR